MNDAREAAIFEAIVRRLGLSSELAEALAHDRGQKELDKNCPQCGQQSILCCHAELGGSLDYRDHFYHVCLNSSCQYVEHVEHHGSVGQKDETDQLCPFCGRDVIGFAEEELDKADRDSSAFSEPTTPSAR